MRILLLLIIVFNCAICSASTVKINFRQQIKYSELIAVVSIKSVEESDDCGYLVNAKILHSYKGSSKELSFWVKKSVDLLDESKKYFIMASLLKKPECGSNDDEGYLYAGTSVQTLFPFEYGGKYILANRESFLTISDSQHYVFDKYVKKMVVINERIFAAAKWSVIHTELEKLLNLN